MTHIRFSSVRLKKGTTKKKMSVSCLVYVSRVKSCYPFKSIRQREGSPSEIRSVTTNSQHVDKCNLLRLNFFRKKRNLY